MKVAIIGSGISGLTVADAIHKHHDITVFEAGDRIGGHTNTIDVEIDDTRHAIDTGFIVFNNRTYPNFSSMIERLGIESHDAPMTFSVRCDQTNLEYRGADLGGLFAQKRNLLRPRFYHLLRDLLRFNNSAQRLIESGNDTQTVCQFFAENQFSRIFYEKYFLPMGSAIWSCPHDVFENFPIRFIAEFYHHHGLLSVNDRPQWKVITGGSSRYIDPLCRPFRNRIQTNCPVLHVHRGRPSGWTHHRMDETDQMVIETPQGNDSFDHVVFACHADQALRILRESATETEMRMLQAFPYQPNEAVLHTDESVLPRRQRAWAAWNYHIADRDHNRWGEKSTLTYNLNILQGIRSRHTFCVTLNSAEMINPKKIIRRISYAHPIFDSRRRRVQQRHTELIGPNQTSFCGAYWGNGFHEDGVVSGLAVSRYLLKRTKRNEKLYLRRARVASTA